MHPALWISKTGLDAQQSNITEISNNLANVNTVGFKKGRAEFQDLLYQVVSQPGAQSSASTTIPTGVVMGTGVRQVSSQKNFAQGNIIESKGTLDLAINGRGFFQVTMPDGTTSYTRDGQFRLSANGEIVNANGYLLQPAITVPTGTVNISIGNDGTISALAAGTPAPAQLGTIQIADFTNASGLQPIGENLYVETAASGAPQVNNPGTTGTGVLIQGSLESSNVNVVEELVHLIEGQRAYEMNSKSIQAVDDMLRFIAQSL